MYGEGILTSRTETSWQDCPDGVDEEEQLGRTTELGNMQGEEIVLKSIKGKKECGANSPNDHRRPRETPHACVA